MQDAIRSLDTRLASFEEIFFTWLTRALAAAVLAGTAWIDDAPPLELAAAILTIYVAARLLMQFGTLTAAAPFESKGLSVLTAIVALVLLVFSFLIVTMFVLVLAEAAVN